MASKGSGGAALPSEILLIGQPIRGLATVRQRRIEQYDQGPACLRRVLFTLRHSVDTVSLNPSMKVLFATSQRGKILEIKWSVSAQSRFVQEARDRIDRPGPALSCLRN
jgi:hypothetical protein